MAHCMHTIPIKKSFSSNCRGTIPKEKSFLPNCRGTIPQEKSFLPNCTYTKPSLQYQLIIQIMIIELSTILSKRILWGYKLLHHNIKQKRRKYLHLFCFIYVFEMNTTKLAIYLITSSKAIHICNSFI